mmetsp:Transcript_23217/g.38723  ORF Transcript_23217/g.38723 Transcript_23217/m.38723 type:complete len:295 (-) Transcript_23217:404-1288(-)
MTVTCTTERTRNYNPSRPLLLPVATAKLSAHGGSGILVVVSEHKSSHGLEEPSTIQGTRRTSADLDELSRHLIRGLGLQASEQLLDLAVGVDVGDFPVHLHHGHIVAVEFVGVCFDGNTAFGLDVSIALRDHGVGGTHNRKTFLAKLLDQLYLQVSSYGLLRDLRGKHADDNIRKFHLRGNELGKVWLTLLDISLYLVNSPTSFGRITLDFPRELNLIRDIKIDGEVKKISDSRVNQRVKTFNNNNGSRLDGLRGIKGTIDVVVDGLGDFFAALQGTQLLCHEVEFLFYNVQSS